MEGRKKSEPPLAFCVAGSKGGRSGKACLRSGGKKRGALGSIKGGKKEDEDNSPRARGIAKIRRGGTGEKKPPSFRFPDHSGARLDKTEGGDGGQAPAKTLGREGED